MANLTSLKQAGIFREDYWQTVGYAVVIGALLGVTANLLSFLGALFQKR